MSRLVLKWLIVFGIIAGLVFWFGASSFSESRVNLTIDGPTQAAVGDEVVYKVKYENQTNTGLRNVRLTFTYPDNSVIMKDGSVVSDSSGVETVDEASLPAGASREQEFHAFLIGDRGNILV